MKKLLLPIFLVSLAVIAYSQEFVPGEMIIGFKGSVDGAEAVRILGELNLELKERSFVQYRNTYYFKTAKHGNANMKNRLDESQLFSLVDIPLDDKGIDMSSDALFAYAKLTTAQNDVTKLVASLRGVSIKSTETTSISLVVAVPNGKENDTVKKAMKHKKVEYAGLNYLSSVDETPNQ